MYLSKYLYLLFLETAIVNEVCIWYFNIVMQDPHPGNPIDLFRGSHNIPEADIEPGTCLYWLDGSYNVRKKT